MKCCVCNSKNTSFFHKFTNYKTPFEVQKCNSCNSLFQINIKDYSQYYTKDYYNQTADYNYYDERKFFQYNSYVWKSRLKTIRKFVTQGNILDIGCAFGGFLQVASQYYNAYGIDISQYAIAEGKSWAKEKGIENVWLYTGDLASIPTSIQNVKFDVVTLVEVAEHLHNPRKVFENIFHIMKKDGVLVIQTANFEGEQAIQEGKTYHYFMPGHLVYYTATALKNMLLEIGFARFIEFIPADISLLSKLQKSRGYFKKLQDYKSWLRTTKYHLDSKKITDRGNPQTSSYVLYAFCS